MSISSRTLKESELGDLHSAQIQAANLPDYHTWLAWMRYQYPYSMAVRMATYLGFKIPARGFYHKMRKEGVKIKKQESKNGQRVIGPVTRVG